MQKISPRKKRIRNRTRAACVLLFALFLMISGVAGCAAHPAKTKIIIGYQFGVAYAPLEIMKMQGLLEKRLPEADIEWRQMGGPTPIREGMLNGSITFGFMGISPVLIGVDHGMPWKYMCGISANRVALVSCREDIDSLADFGPYDRIAILSPGCTQHVLLSVLAARELGDAKALDGQLVSMTHPDAMNALMSGTEIAAHMATPPYIEEELAQGMKVIADGEEIMGRPFTFICGVAMTDYVRENGTTYELFLEALGEAVDYINEHMEEACDALADVYEISPDALYAQMTYNGTIYSTSLAGVPEMARAMAQCGFISEVPPYDEIVFDNVKKEMP
ncbi:MAG: ABC transporter substrate-binding protein [Lachnospiraceae bacterium]|nr:ABC transporter substrate-binding protein [Lachnospiraceae bacterium]